MAYLFLYGIVWQSNSLITFFLFQDLDFHNQPHVIIFIFNPFYAHVSHMQLKILTSFINRGSY